MKNSPAKPLKPYLCSKMRLMKNIVIFASGNGSNAQRIAEYFASEKDVIIKRIYSNKPGAYVLTRANQLGISSFVFDRSDFYDQDTVLNELSKDKPDLIVLAGFLWKIPDAIIQAYADKIINIHPALLPKFGGKGMYGSRVHEAVIDSGDKVSGITIHYVNNRYDEGKVIFQARCSVLPADTPETLASRIHALEYAHFPAVIHSLLFGKPLPGV